MSEDTGSPAEPATPPGLWEQMPWEVQCAFGSGQGQAWVFPWKMCAGATDHTVLPLPSSGVPVGGETGVRAPSERQTLVSRVGALMSTGPAGP